MLSYSKGCRLSAPRSARGGAGPAETVFPKGRCFGSARGKGGYDEQYFHQDQCAPVPGPAGGAGEGGAAAAGGHGGALRQERAALGVLCGHKPGGAGAALLVQPLHPLRGQGPAGHRPLLAEGTPSGPGLQRHRPQRRHGEPAAGGGGAGAGRRLDGGEPHPGADGRGGGGSVPAGHPGALRHCAGGLSGGGAAPGGSLRS